MLPKKLPPSRFFGLDIHKHYLVAIGVDPVGNQIYGPRKVNWTDLETWRNKTLTASDAVSTTDRKLVLYLRMDGTNNVVTGFYVTELVPQIVMLEGLLVGILDALVTGDSQEHRQVRRTGLDGSFQLTGDLGQG